MTRILRDRDDYDHSATLDLLDDLDQTHGALRCMALDMQTEVLIDGQR